MSDQALKRLERKLAIMLLDAKRRNDQVLKYDVEECITLVEIIIRGLNH